MKWMIAGLIGVLVLLQYRLWGGEGGLTSLNRLESEIEIQKAENARLIERNRLLDAEVTALRKGGDAIEERARHDLGMIKEGETFFMVVQSSSSE